jgi:hypothetical protein
MKMGKGDDIVYFGKGVTFKVTSTVGDETFTYKGIKKGVEIPSVRAEINSSTIAVKR